MLAIMRISAMLHTDSLSFGSMDIWEKETDGLFLAIVLQPLEHDTLLLMVYILATDQLDYKYSLV